MIEPEEMSGEALQQECDRLLLEREQRLGRKSGKTQTGPTIVNDSNAAALLPTPPSQVPLGKHVLIVNAAHDESDDQVGARTRFNPAVQAAMTSSTFDRKQGDIQANALVDELAKHVAAVQSGDLSRPEAILMGQAQALDTMFHQLAQIAGRKLDNSHAISVEQFLCMALKVQSQCRATLEALAEIKNPRQASFIKQQNIAHQQQVNNGVAPEKSSHGKKRRAVKQTIGGTDGERLDP